MSHSNGLITAPVNARGDVMAVLGAPNAALSTLCTMSNINIWARYKPIDYNAVFPTRGSGWGAAGVRVTEYTSVRALMTAIKANGWKSSAGWYWKKPKGGANSPYRLGDFNGYDHNAPNPVSSWSFETGATGQPDYYSRAETANGTPRGIAADANAFMLQAGNRPTTYRLTLDDLLGAGTGGADGFQLKNCYFSMAMALADLSQFAIFSSASTWGTATSNNILISQQRMTLANPNAQYIAFPIFSHGQHSRGMGTADINDPDGLWPMPVTPWQFTFNVIGYSWDVVFRTPTLEQEYLSGSMVIAFVVDIVKLSASASALPSWGARTIPIKYSAAIRETNGRITNITYGDVDYLPAKADGTTNADGSWTGTFSHRFEAPSSGTFYYVRADIQPGDVAGFFNVRGGGAQYNNVTS